MVKLISNSQNIQTCVLSQLTDFLLLIAILQKYHCAWCGGIVTVVLERNEEEIKLGF